MTILLFDLNEGLDSLPLLASLTHPVGFSCILRNYIRKVTVTFKMRIIKAEMLLFRPETTDRFRANDVIIYVDALIFW
jgi:hypothetical protein